MIFDIHHKNKKLNTFILIFFLLFLIISDNGFSVSSPIYQNIQPSRQNQNIINWFIKTHDNHIILFKFISNNDATKKLSIQVIKTNMQYKSQVSLQQEDIRKLSYNYLLTIQQIQKNFVNQEKNIISSQNLNQNQSQRQKFTITFLQITKDKIVFILPSINDNINIPLKHLQQFKKDQKSNQKELQKLKQQLKQKNQQLQRQKKSSSSQSWYSRLNPKFDGQGLQWILAIVAIIAIFFIVLDQSIIPFQYSILIIGILGIAFFFYYKKYYNQKFVYLQAVWFVIFVCLLGICLGTIAFGVHLIILAKMKSNRGFLILLTISFIFKNDFNQKINFLIPKFVEDNYKWLFLIYLLIPTLQILHFQEKNKCQITSTLANEDKKMINKFEDYLTLWIVFVILGAFTYNFQVAHKFSKIVMLGIITFYEVTQGSIKKLNNKQN